jgi:hypothetical protein
MLIVMLSAIAQAQSVTLLPASYTFPNQAIDTPSQPEAFTLKNGTTSSITLTITTGAGFNETDNCGSSLGAGKSCTINARFRPTLAQLYSNEKLNVTYNTNKSVYSLLSGTGIPDVSLSPGNWSPGNAFIDTTNTQQNYTITNNESTASVTVNSVVLSSGSGFSAGSNCNNIMIPASGTCVFTVSFDPTQIQAYSETLTVTATGASGTTALPSVNLSGDGIYPALTGSFFSVDINQKGIATDPWPGTAGTNAANTNFGTYRTLGSGLKWSDLYDCSANSYNFAALGAWMQLAVNANQNLMITGYYTPDCLAAPLSGTNYQSYCAFYNQKSALHNTQYYGCNLPSDVLETNPPECAAVGQKVPDCTWITFVQGLLNYVVGQKFPNTIYLEVWNEVNQGTECAPVTIPNGPTGGICTQQALAQMTSDANTYGKAIVSNLQIISPTVTATTKGACTSSSTEEGIAAYFQNMFSAYPSIYTNSDVIGFHGYVDIPALGTGAPDPASGASCESDLIASVKTALYDAIGSSTTKPLYDTEGSWGADCKPPQGQTCPYTPNSWIQGSSQPADQVQAEEAAFTGAYYLIQASNQPNYITTCTACDPLEGFSWYGWDFDGQGDPGSTGQFWYQFSDPFGSAPNLTPAGTAYTVMNSWLLGTLSNSQPVSPSGPCTVTLNTNFTSTNLGVWTCPFKGPGGYTAMAVWDSSQTCINNFDSKGHCKYSNMTGFTFPAGTYTEWHDLYNDSANSIGNTLTGLPIGLVPILLDNGMAQ